MATSIARWSGGEYTIDLPNGPGNPSIVRDRSMRARYARARGRSRVQSGIRIKRSHLTFAATETSTDVNHNVPFERIVAGHGATVLRVCRAVLDPADADDAWSETFLSALKAYPHLPPGANVEAWLVTIAHRKAIDIARAMARRALPVGEVPESPELDGTEAPDHDLAGAMSRLPAKQRQVIAYHYLAGLPYAEIGTIIGGSADAARRAAADGIATLRRTFPHIPNRKGRTS